MSAPAKASPSSMQTSVDTENNPLQQDIANLAYALWQQRGSPEGSAEEDWKEAETRLRAGSKEAVSSGRR